MGKEWRSGGGKARGTRLMFEPIPEYGFGIVLMVARHFPRARIALWAPGVCIQAVIAPRPVTMVRCGGQ
jgi:hypothetical protein